MDTNVNTPGTPGCLRRGQAIAALSAAVVAVSALLVSTATTADPHKPRLSRAKLADLQEQVNSSVGVSQSELLVLEGINPEPGNIISVQIPIDGAMHTLDLAPHSVRSDNYKVFAQNDNGELIEIEPGPVRTLNGQIRELPDSTAVGGLNTEGGLTATIHTGDGLILGLEQAATRVDGADPQLHILYDTQFLDGPVGVCGWSEEWQLGQGVPLPPPPDGGAGGGGGLGGLAGGEVFNCVKIGVDADFQYYQDWGSNTSSVEDRVNLVLATVNVQYERDVAISHLIEAIIIRTSSASNPYTTNDAGSLLGQFENHWDANHTDIDRDVAHLFTGRSLNGGTIGIAWLGVVCDTNDAYSVVESDCCGSLQCAADLSSHELGHNWGAGHCSCSSHTMNASLASCNMQFHPTFTIPTIEGYRDSGFGSCTFACAGPSTELPFFDNFPSTSIDVTLWVTAEQADPNTLGLNEPSPAFSLEISGNGLAETAQMDASGASELLFSYYVQRTGNGNSPETGEDLVVSYENDSGSWIEINRHLGSGPDETTFTLHEFTLDGDAMHSGFRIRFENLSGNTSNDDYYVDDMSIVAVVAAENNDCANALIVSAGVNTAYTTAGATTDGPSESGSCGATVNNDLWYRYFALCDGTVTIDVSGSDYDHSIAVYSNLGCPSGNNEAVACLEAPATSMTFSATLGQAFRIRVGDSGSGEGSAQFLITCEETPGGCDEDCASPSDDEVNIIDLLALLAEWGTNGDCDFDGGGISVTDLLQMLAAWGGDCS